MKKCDKKNFYEFSTCPYYFVGMCTYTKLTGKNCKYDKKGIKK